MRPPCCTQDCQTTRSSNLGVSVWRAFLGRHASLLSSLCHVNSDSPHAQCVIKLHLQPTKKNRPTQRTVRKKKKHPDFYRKKGFLAAQNPLQMGYKRYARLFCCFRGLLPSKKRRKYLFVAFNVRSDPSLSKKRFSTFLSLLMYSRVPPPRKSGLSTFLSLLMCSRVPPPPKSGVSTFPSPSIYKSHF